MTRSSWLTGALLAGLFFALHLPFLPPSLEDLDSINFALGVRHYDVSQHQPHPPGYPLFILAAKTLHKIGLSEVHALSLVSVLGGALGVFGCFALFQALERSYVSDVVSGFSRTSSSSNAPHDGAWEAATHVATTSESSFRVRTQQAPLAAYAHSNVVPTVGNARISDLLDVVRDRSPQHSLPLLI